MTMIEKGLHDYLVKRYGSWESADVVKDDGKSITLKIDFGDEEVLTVVINRRDGYNGNYRVVMER